MATTAIQNSQIESIIDRLAQCVDRIGEIQIKQASTSDKLAIHLEKMDKLETHLEKMGARIGELEKWQYKALGFLAALAIAFELFKTLK
jgi:archaellum component FlaC